MTGQSHVKMIIMQHRTQLTVNVSRGREGLLIVGSGRKGGRKKGKDCLRTRWGWREALVLSGLHGTRWPRRRLVLLLLPLLVRVLELLGHEATRHFENLRICFEKNYLFCFVLLMRSDFSCGFFVAEAGEHRCGVFLNVCCCCCEMMCCCCCKFVKATLI